MSIFTDVTAIRTDADAQLAQAKLQTTALATIENESEIQSVAVEAILAEAKLQTAALAQINKTLTAMLNAMDPPVVGLRIDHGPPTKKQ